MAQFTANFAQQVGELKVNEVAQSFEFLSGISYRIWDWHPTFFGPENNTAEKLGVHVILGGGVATPLTPKDSVQIFQVPQNQQNFFSVYPQANGVQFVAFTLPDRNRFFREAYGGFRLVTRTWWNGKTDTTNGTTDTKDDCKNHTPTKKYCLDMAPAVLDITYGFNEAVTGGVIHGGVMRVEGFVPLPFRDHQAELIGLPLCHRPVQVLAGADFGAIHPGWGAARHLGHQCPDGGNHDSPGRPRLLSRRHGR